MGQFEDVDIMISPPIRDVRVSSVPKVVPIAPGTHRLRLWYPRPRMSSTVAALVIRPHQGRFFYEAKFRVDGQQVKRRIGPAWLESDERNGWRPRRGRVQDGYFDERRAHVRAAELVDEFLRIEGEQRRAEAERLKRPPSFRDLAADYMRWLEHDYKARPATLRDHRYLLADPGTPHQRGRSASAGRIMAALGDMAAQDISPEHVRELLSNMAESGMSARNVNKHRNLIAAVFNHGVRRGSGKFKLASSPTDGIELRREPKPAPLLFFSPDEIEAIANALEAGDHRAAQQDGAPPAADERPLRRRGDKQDGEAVRLAGYTGLRRGELVALRWRDIDWKARKITVSRAISDGVEGPPKSGHYRDVPLSEQAAAALRRLAEREEFCGSDDYVLCNSLGRRLDPAALGRRYNKAREAAGLRQLRWHDLRHTFGSLLVAAGIDTVTVKAAMGHERISTTERYLHARPATQQAAAFTAAFEPACGFQRAPDLRAPDSSPRAFRASGFRVA
jgi:integrase